MAVQRFQARPPESQFGTLPTTPHWVQLVICIYDEANKQLHHYDLNVQNALQNLFRTI